MDTNKVVLTVAVTGAIGNRSNPVIPITPVEIAESALESREAGASVAHIHVRDLETGEPSMEIGLYEEVVKRIRDQSDMIINLTTGPGGIFIPNDSDSVSFPHGFIWAEPKKRIEHVLKIKPELCSLEVGSMNYGPGIFAVYLPHLEWMADKIRDAGVKPELEVFELGHIEIAKHLLKTGKVKSPSLFQLGLGAKWGIPASPYNLCIIRGALPSDVVWAAFGIGAAAYPVLSQTVSMGGHVRIGLEDNYLLQKGKPAKSNRELVEKAVAIIQNLGKEPASPDEARNLLGL